MDRDKFEIDNFNSWLDDAMLNNSSNGTIKEESSNELGSFILSEISEDNDITQANPEGKSNSKFNI